MEDVNQSNPVEIRIQAIESETRSNFKSTAPLARLAVTLNDDAEAVRRAAAEYIFKIASYQWNQRQLSGSKEKGGPGWSEELKATLLKRLKDENRHVRNAVVVTLGIVYSEDSEMKTEFLKAMSEERHPHVLAKYCEVLTIAGYSDEVSSGILVKLLSSSSEEVQATTARTMSKLKLRPDGALPTLVRLLEARSSRLRTASANAIAEFDASAEKYLMKIKELRLEESNSLTRLALEEAITRIENP